MCTIVDFDLVVMLAYHGGVGVCYVLLVLPGLEVSLPLGL